MTVTEDNGSILSNWYIIRGSVVLFITLGIIFSNVINLIVWKKNKRMPTATRLFLINLSVSDLLVGIFATSLAIYPAFKGEWPYGNVWCQISGVVHGMSVTLSIWSIAMVGIDRYFAAVKPYKYKTLMSRKRSFIIVGCMWIAAFTTFLAPLFTKSNFIYYKYKNHDAFCGLHWEYPLYCIITGFYIPIGSAFILSFTSIKIHRNLVANKKSAKQNQDHSNNTSSEKHSKKMAAINQRALLILITAATIFFIFWGPYVVVYVSQSFYGNFYVSDEVKFCIIWIANANSMVNVFVYSLTNKSFQDEAKSLILTCYSANNNNKEADAGLENELRNSEDLIDSPKSPCGDVLSEPINHDGESGCCDSPKQQKKINRDLNLKETENLGVVDPKYIGVDFKI